MTDVRIICSHDAGRLAETLTRLLEAEEHRVRLTIGRVAQLLDIALRWVAPFRRLAVLRENVPAFRKLNVLVVPETTSLLLRDRFGLDTLKFVWIPHGAGDRSVGFRDVMRGFDLVLLSGAKVRDRMLALGLITPQNHAIIGYPKFDTVDFAAPPERLFANDRPTLLYNPHFDPRLSSWYPWGEQLVDAIAARGDVNLLVAPHVMLFKRRIHASLEHRRIRWRRTLPGRWAGTHGLIVDPGSTRSIDMTYTRAADVYIGDASSQIYEWIARPRPAIFLNPHRIDWIGNPDFAHWRLGEVIERIGDLPAAIDRALADPGRFSAVQAAAFAETFDGVGTSAATRAAEAILARYGRRSPDS